MKTKIGISQLWSFSCGADHAIIEGIVGKHMKSWRSHYFMDVFKHIIITRSTTEAKFTSSNTTMVESNWFVNSWSTCWWFRNQYRLSSWTLIIKLLFIKVHGSEDNMKSSRHVARILKYARKNRNSRVVMLDYIQTTKNLAYSSVKG